MITDMFAGNNQSTASNLSALISNNYGTGSRNLAFVNDNQSSQAPDFSALLSQQIGFDFSPNSQDVSFQKPEKSNATTSSLRNSLSSARLKTGNFINLSERNSFQNSFDISSIKTSSFTETFQNSNNSVISKGNERINETNVSESKQEDDANVDEKEAKKASENEETSSLDNIDEPENLEESEKEEDAEAINFEAIAQSLQIQEQAQNQNSDIEADEIADMENIDSEKNNSGLKLADKSNNQSQDANNTDSEETAESNDFESILAKESQQIAPQETVSNKENLEIEGEKLASAISEDSNIENESADKESSAKDNLKKADSKLNEIVEDLKEDDSVLPKESLRQEFAKAIGQEEQSQPDNSNNELAQQAIDNEQQASQAAATANNPADETANRIFAALSEKNSESNSKQATNHIIEVSADGLNKNSAMNQNNGSSMNNGFSFKSDTPQTYNENGKIAQNPNVPSTSFSELLTKAEMVKTKDGAKVMNLELEQEGIGKLELELTSKDGEVTARLSAESDLAKAKLEELTPQIKENLIEKGVNLTQINVDVSSKDADGNGSEYQNSGKRNKSNRLGRIGSNSVKDIIEKRILPNLRHEALNIQSVDQMV